MPSPWARKLERENRVETCGCLGGSYGTRHEVGAPGCWATEPEPIDPFKPGDYSDAWFKREEQRQRDYDDGIIADDDR